VILVRPVGAAAIVAVNLVLSALALAWAARMSTPTKPMMILVAGPYRSGTGDDPAAITVGELAPASLQVRLVLRVQPVLAGPAQHQANQEHVHAQVHADNQQA